MKRKLKLFSAVSMVSVLFAVVFSTIHTQAQGMMKAPEFQVVVGSKYSFSDTVELLKGAIEGENLMVVKEIDAQRMLRMINVQTKGMKQILFFHPRFMKQIMGINKHATIEPPLKVAVMETPDGRVMVKYIKPSYLLGRYKGLKEVGGELDGVVAKIVESVQK